MDFVFFSGLQGNKIRRLVVSYDIACQWHRNLRSRMEDLPHQYHIRFDEEDGVIVVFLVPKFHLPAHIDKCHVTYSFNLTPYVGRTDGEGIERAWANSNPISTQTKEMGPGSRRDTLDDHFGDWNWKQTVAMGA
jgi:hypothetical protein